MSEEIKTQAVAEQEAKPIVICTAAFFVEGSDKPVTVSGDNPETLLNIINSVMQSIVPFVQLAQNADGGPVIINRDKVTHIELFVNQQLTKQVNQQQDVGEPDPATEEASK